jgi:hypothetical protein
MCPPRIAADATRAMDNNYHRQRRPGCGPSAAARTRLPPGSHSRGTPAASDDRSTASGYSSSDACTAAPALTCSAAVSCSPASDQGKPQRGNLC